MNPRFLVLSFVSKLLIWIGWIIFGLSFVATVVSAITLYERFEADNLGGFLIRLAIVIFGILVIAAGESIGVFFAIEANTRKAADALSEVRSRLPATPNDKG